MTVLVVAIAALWLPLAGVASASPAYRLGGLQCDNGRLLIYPPPYMDSSYNTDLRNPERVEWSPDLYRWYGRRRGWRRIISAPWYVAYTSDYGYFQFQFRGAWLAPNNNGVSFVPYTINRAGRYRIKQYLYWAEGPTDPDESGIKVSRWTASCTYR